MAAVSARKQDRQGGYSPINFLRLGPSKESDRVRMETVASTGRGADGARADDGPSMLALAALPARR